ncbi:MAG: transporter related [Acidimicrobiales bacterium]|nr:transporter related [Acidimicrobiales bacterium]
MIAFAHEVRLEVVVLGLITGLSYALLAVGLVLTYKSSRVLNFAHGQMGALGAALIPVLVVHDHLNYWLAVLIALLAAAAAGAFCELVAIRKLAKAPRLVALVATIGLAQLFFAVEALLPRKNLGSAIFPTPFRADFTIGSLHLHSAQLLILAIAPLIVVALSAFLQRTTVGLASRASAENTDAAYLAGIPVRKISLAVWIVAGLLAGVSAILVGPTRPIITQQSLGPGLLLRALAAAMIGGLDSLPWVFAGGLGIGLLESLVLWNYPSGGTLEVVLFVVVLVSFIARRRLGQLARGGEQSSWSLAGALRAVDPVKARLSRVRLARRVALAAGIVAAALVAVPMSNAQRVLASSVVLFAMMGLSLVVLTGYAGQISLGQFAFVSLGALVGGRLHQLGYPAPVAMLYAVLAGGLAALIVGLPALRIRGLFLAVTTLAFAVAGQTWLFGQHWLVQISGGTTSLEIPRPHWFGINFQRELPYYWLCLGVLVVVGAIVHRLPRTGAGRAMMAVRDNEAATATLSVSPRRIKLVAFVLSGMIAALAGYLYGGMLVSFGDPNTFTPDYSLTLVALVVLGGVTTVTGAVLGAIWVEGLGYILAPILPGLLGGQVALLISGVGLLGAILTFPGGLAQVAFMVRDRIVDRLAGAPATRNEDAEDPGLAAVPARARLQPRAGEHLPAVDGDAVPLEARGVTVRFGGNVAVDDVTMRVRRGEILGLIGPNGAGKTTLFDVLSGQLRPDAGEVLYEGEDITWLPPEQRARLGLGRTFQQARLFDELPLVDAVKVALEREEPSEFVPSLLGLPPSRAAERRKDIRASELIELLGLGQYADRHIAELSTGVRRMAELGCVIALGAEVVLLDEPTAGIAQREVEAFRPVLREVRDHLDATVVLIEHDIPMVMSVVDRLYVLVSGSVIAEGPPSLLREDPAVIAAYLGTDERVIARSGTAATALAADLVGGRS